MSTRLRLGPLILAVVLAIGAVPARPPDPVSAATPEFSMRLGEPRDFVAQDDFVQCVGASLQMMLNIIQPGGDRSARTQRRLQALARAWSGPRPPGFGERQGASIRGWKAGLVIHGAGPYRIVGADSLREAMRIAATAIRTWERPVGLLVWRGRHAWVMSGFQATADPALTDDFRVTKAYILDPLYPHGSATWGPSPEPGSAISVAAVGRQFVRRQIGGPWNTLPGFIDLSGKYVLLVPTTYPRPGIA